MEYTGIQNVYLNGTMIGFTKEEIDAKLKDILEFADIGDLSTSRARLTLQVCLCVWRSRLRLTSIRRY